MLRMSRTDFIFGSFMKLMCSWKKKNLWILKSVIFAFSSSSIFISKERIQISKQRGESANCRENGIGATSTWSQVMQMCSTCCFTVCHQHYFWFRAWALFMWTPLIVSHLRESKQHIGQVLCSLSSRAGYMKKRKKKKKKKEMYIISLS